MTNENYRGERREQVDYSRLRRGWEEDFSRFRETKEKVRHETFVVGDGHGYHEEVMDTLGMAGVIDGKERWSGEDRVVVLTGDMVDRGPAGPRLVETFFRLQDEARSAGGQVVYILGNHENFWIEGDTASLEHPKNRGLAAFEVRLAVARAWGDPKVRSVEAARRKVVNDFGNRLEQAIEDERIVMAYGVGGKMCVHGGVDNDRYAKILNAARKIPALPGESATEQLARICNESLRAIKAGEESALSWKDLQYIMLTRFHPARGLYRPRASKGNDEDEDAEAAIPQHLEPEDLEQIVGHTANGRQEIGVSDDENLVIGVDVGLDERTVPSVLRLQRSGMVSSVTTRPGVLLEHRRARGHVRVWETQRDLVEMRLKLTKNLRRLEDAVLKGKHVRLLPHEIEILTQFLWLADRKIAALRLTKELTGDPLLRSETAVSCIEHLVANLETGEKWDIDSEVWLRKLLGAIYDL